MSIVEELVGAIVAQLRWGLHPLKVFVALLLPIVIVWLADRWLRARIPPIEETSARSRSLPRIRRR